MRVNFLPTRVCAPIYKTKLNNEAEPSTEPKPESRKLPAISCPIAFTALPPVLTAGGSNVVRFAADAIEEVVYHVGQITENIINHHKLSRDFAGAAHKTLCDLSREPNLVIDEVIRRTDLCGKTLLSFLPDTGKIPTVSHIYHIATEAGTQTREALGATIEQHGQMLYDHAYQKGDVLNAAVFLQTVLAVAPEQIVRIKVSEDVKNSEFFQDIAYAVLQNSHLRKDEIGTFLEGYRYKDNLLRSMSWLKSGAIKKGAPTDDFLIAPPPNDAI